MKHSIGTTLKNARKSAGMTVEDVYNFLAENNINSAIKTIYGWEHDFSYPSINTFLLLCKLYGINDILETFGYGSIEKHISLCFTEEEYSKDELNELLKYANYLKSKHKI